MAYYICKEDDFNTLKNAINRKLEGHPYILQFSRTDTNSDNIECVRKMFPAEKLLPSIAIDQVQEKAE
jgi:hypothetical protein